MVCIRIMPWTPDSFATKHNHKLSGKAARGAAEVANEQLAKGASDATAIKIGNAVGDRVMAHEGGGKVTKHWIQGAVKHPGALHRDLGVPQGEKIPRAKIEAAAHSSNPTLRHRAQFAENVPHHADGGKVKTFPLPSSPGKPPAPKPQDPPYRPFPDEVSGADTAQAYESGGCIKSASYATGGGVCNSSTRYAKGGFKSNAGDFH